ncbi:zinc finger protein OZF-like [Maniola jurtina]|uniref:zinc finger protein OZF-like n=1 Tax=Maniola jurtina TaxID=191418 RepID=UPI001E68B8F9|nr:zinc finger protein OZF-like [Maniola jurtina]XP_045782711.1 zinc finger protein OZF-like [Maniola jurtina]XP_045782713.1 zinc finger protein OZF-like [Maniola jurtina]
MSEFEEAKPAVDGGTLFKQEPEDPDNSETCCNEYDSLFDVFKQEMCSNSPKMEQSDCHVDTLATITDFKLGDVSPAYMEIHIKPEPSPAEVSVPAERGLTLAALLAKKPKPMNHSKTDETSTKIQNYFDSITQQTLNKVTEKERERESDNREMNREDSMQGGSVARREDSHTGDTLSCDDCSYKTVNKRNLLVHIQTHTKLYFCEHCDYKGPSANELARHAKTHTGEKPFSCIWCDYKYSWASSLKRHMRTHTGEKPYSCNHCDYKCSTASYLKAHKMTHTGEKPFSCDHCDYKCSQKNHLKTHMRTHTGAKPFACTQCESKFSTAGHLKSHINTHTGYKPYACKLCDYKCTRGYSLKVHNMRNHSGSGKKRR